MSDSIINMTCDNCAKKYDAACDGLVRVMITYVTKCPQCGSQNTFINKSGFYGDTPFDSVKAEELVC